MRTNNTRLYSLISTAESKSPRTETPTVIENPLEKTFQIPEMQKIFFSFFKPRELRTMERTSKMFRSGSQAEIARRPKRIFYGASINASISFRVGTVGRLLTIGDFGIPFYITEPKININLLKDKTNLLCHFKTLTQNLSMCFFSFNQAEVLRRDECAPTHTSYFEKKGDPVHASPIYTITYVFDNPLQAVRPLMVTPEIISNLIPVAVNYHSSVDYHWRNEGYLPHPSRRVSEISLCDNPEEFSPHSSAQRPTRRR